MEPDRKICPFCEEPILYDKEVDPATYQHTVSLPDGSVAHKYCHDEIAREIGIVSP